ncbi:TPA: HNH endonuclease [Clostridioides difficile]|nr:HNH endonuclease [Clostridioides difficile]
MIECIPYPGYRDRDGYGQINSNKEGTLRAARIVLEERLQRPIRNGYQAHHTCYNRCCVNPSHIEERKVSENILDKYFNDRPEINEIVLTKESVYLTKYLLNNMNNSEFNYSIEEIAKFLSIPLELLLYIKKGSVWNYIYLTNAEKVEALHKLEIFFPKEVCIEANWGSEKYCPVVHKNNKQIKASRYSYDTYTNTSSSGKYILHNCDNPLCIRASHLRTGDQKDNINDKVQRRRTNRDYYLYNQEIIKKIVQLRDVENYSFSKIGREIAILVKRDKPYDHKTVISIYKNYKYTRREELKEKPPTQRELLNKHIDTLIDLKHNYNYSLRQISHKLGSNLIGKPFDLNVIGQVYKEHISKQNLIPPKSSIKLLEENITEILSMLDCNISLREIANRLTKKLNPNKPFHHNQITKVVNKYKK